MLMKEFEIELAITSPRHPMREFVNYLPGGYLIEDRSETGWGFVIRPNEQPSFGSVSEDMSDFLRNMEDMRKFLLGSDLILRLAVYSDSADTTITLDCRYVESLGAKLEISFYPSVEQE